MNIFEIDADNFLLLYTRSNSYTVREFGNTLNTRLPASFSFVSLESEYTLTYELSTCIYPLGDLNLCANPVQVRLYTYQTFQHAVDGCQYSSLLYLKISIFNSDYTLIFGFLTFSYITSKVVLTRALRWIQDWK